ncbi:MAG: TrkH family potassium uptake protein [Actinomycetes bacterium]
MARRRPVRSWVLRHPAVLVVVAYLAVLAVATVVLLLPVSRSAAQGPSLVTALFTATSALCITGLTVVDTARAWSGFGHVVITVLIQLGGLGIMAAASLLGITVSRRLGLRTRLLAQTETKGAELGEVRRVLLGVALISATVEAVVAVLLAARLALGYGYPLGEALWYGAFHSIASFTNAGFSLWPDGLIRFATDPWFCVPVLLAIVIGGLGFPVLLELLRDRVHWDRWSLHTKLTLVSTAVLLVVGPLVVTVLEWGNDGTLGRFGVPARVLVGIFQGISPRTAGFSTVDYGQMHDTTWAVTDALMFVGGGSAGTSGGIKLTTAALLVLAIVAEARGSERVEVFGRSIPATSIRQAVSVAVLATAIVGVATLMLMELGNVRMDRAMFESVSAFATTGLTTGITASLPDPAKFVLIVLMFVGRVGTITVASALALRTSRRLYRLPKERPIVG